LWSKDNLRERFWKPAVAAAQHCAQHPPAPYLDRRGRQRDNPKAASTCACPGRLHQTPRFHDTRHTHVAWLIDAGWNPYNIQRRIGHESIKTTFDIYGHLLPDADDQALDALDQLATAGKHRRHPPAA